MQKTFLYAALVGCIVFLFPAFSNAQVYFSGWVSSADNIPDDGFNDMPSQSVDSYSPHPKPHKKTKQHRDYSYDDDNKYDYEEDNYTYGAPTTTNIKEDKVIIVDPIKHHWAAYANGKLVRSGLATAGARWCDDISRPCKTRAGTFRIYSLGSEDCISSKYPVGEGGAPMPYCMYFNGSQGLHGSNQVVAGNVSHGCVRVRVSDAEWIRYNFARVGTKVIVKPY